MDRQVYKVVAVNGDKKTSAFLSDFRYTFDLKVSYPEGEWVKPPVGKLFAFGGLKSAERFARQLGTPYLSRKEVWLADAKDVTRLRRRIFTSASDIARVCKAFWEGMRTDISWTHLPPPGTLVCSEIKLLRKV